MDRGVEDLGPEPPAWWQRGQPMQLTMAAVAEHVVVQEDIVMAAVAEPAGDEPAAAGHGAGADEPAEPCTKRRKTHVPPEVREWFCSLTRVMPDWTMTQCFRFEKRALPSFFEHMHIDTPRKWFSRKTPGTALGRPRSLEPAVVLALADIVSRVCSKVCCGSGVLAELLNAHLAVPLLRTPYTPIHAITWVLLQETQGRAGEGVARSNDTDTPRTVPAEDRVDIERCRHHRRSRIINIDETCCKMLPLLERGWLARGEQDVVMDTRRNITVFLATRHLVPDVYAQLIFQGNTFAVEPANPYPSLLTTSHSESHWTTTTTLTAFLTWLDTTVMNPDGSSTPWICFMGRVYRARQPRVLDPPSGDACPHPARLRAAQHHGRVPAVGQSLHEAIQGRIGSVLCTVHWSGNP